LEEEMKIFFGMLIGGAILALIAYIGCSIRLVSQIGKKGKRFFD
jgi:hypothetical protein